MKQTRKWLATVSDRTLSGTLETERLYNDFRKDLPDILEKLTLRPEDVQFVEYVKVAMEWLKAQP